MDTPTPALPPPPTAAEAATMVASMAAWLLAVKLTAPALLITLSWM